MIGGASRRQSSFGFYILAISYISMYKRKKSVKIGGALRRQSLPI
jgi:hypothetical protein